MYFTCRLTSKGGGILLCGMNYEYGTHSDRYLIGTCLGSSGGIADVITPRDGRATIGPII